MNFNHLLSLDFTNDNIAIIKLNATALPTNLLTYSFLKAYQQAIETAFANENILGIIVISEKRDFIAGGDLKAFANPTQTKAEVFAEIMDMHKIMRSIELKQKPIVAAINGNALGGGFEFALACTYRIALDNDAIKIGLPEVNLGLIPGAGGTQRLMRIIGLQDAIANVLQCKLLSPKNALKAGFIHEVAANIDDLIAAAKNYIIKTPIAAQPWDIKGFKIPKGSVHSPAGYNNIAGAIGNLRKQTHGHYPGATAALSALYDGSIINSIDKALEIEARYFVQALFSKEAANLIKTGFFAINEAKKGKNRPSEIEKNHFKSIGVLGAGMMGAGIAYAASMAGIQVFLVDTSLEQAEKGKSYTANLLNKNVEKGSLAAQLVEPILNNIICSIQLEDLAKVDLVIEAVNEDLVLKNNILKAISAIIGENTVLASNTSTLPISTLAEASNNAKNFIGMHFFSPVDKMPLLEIIKGKETSNKAIATAIDFALQIGKTPILVNDAFAFFTSRVFSTYTAEAALMLEEGIKPILIENAAKSAGFAVGPLAVTDEVSLTLALNILQQMPNTIQPAHADKLIEVYTKVIASSGIGKKANKGFYEYSPNGEKNIASILSKLFPIAEHQPTKELLAARLFSIMALEAYKALEEGIIEEAKDADVASILGFAFPAYTGGVLSYINYIGVAQFVENCQQLEMAYGPRFTVPTSLIALAESNQQVLI